MLMMFNQFGNYIMDIIFAFTFSFIGGAVKDVYNTLIGKEKKVNIARIAITSIVGTIVSFSFSDIIVNMWGIKIFTLLSFASGLVGFELLGRFTKLTFWVKAITNRKNILDNLEKITEEEKKKNDNNDKKEETKNNKK